MCVIKHPWVLPVQNQGPNLNTVCRGSLGDVRRTKYHSFGLLKKMQVLSSLEFKVLKQM